MTDRHIIGIGLTLLATIGYGTAPPLVRLGFEHGVPVLESVLMRTGIITLVLGALVLFSGTGLYLPRKAFAALALQVLATVMTSFGYLASVAFIPVAQAVIVFFMFPVLILLAAPLVEGGPVSMWRLAVAGLAFFGLAVATGPQFNTLNPAGLALAFIAAVGAMLQFFSGRSLARYLPASVTGFLVHLILLPTAFLAALATGSWRLALLTTGSVAATGYIAAFAVGLAYACGYFCHMKALTRAPSSVVAPFFNTEPLIAISVAYILLGQTLTVNQYAGGIVVLAALLISAFISSLEHGRLGWKQSKP